MSIPGDASPLLLGGGAQQYKIERSLRFNSSDSAYLSRTPASAGNRKTWTWAGWVKRSNITSSQALFGTLGSSNDSTTLYLAFVYDSLRFSGYSTPTSSYIYTSQVFRDTSAWLHLVLTLDTTQATAANRLKLYINGQQITSFSTDQRSLIAQNADLPINSTQAHDIGRVGSAGIYGDFYLADVFFIDGQALDPSSFTEVSATTGQLIPKAYTGTYGTNGFRLAFADNSNNTATTLGKDSSGNGNNWTPNNLSVTAGAGNDSLVDTPTSYGTDTGAGGEVRGNYATLNPLANGGNTLFNGNLQGAGASDKTTLSTIGMSSGKWYCEVTIDAVGISCQVGIAKNNVNLLDWIGRGPVDWSYGNSGQKLNNNTGSAYGNSYTTGNIISIAFDADAGSLFFYKNGTIQNSGTAAFTGLTDGPYFFGFGANGPSVTFNFGQRPFAYTAPSGFKALCDTNLPAPVVAKPNTAFDVALWTGNGSARSITGLNFNPDFVWIKGRSGATDHALYDVVRGTEKRLESNNTDTEVTSDGGVTAFNSDGFSLGTLAQVNTNTGTYAGWAWDAGSSTVTNTQGSITSQVRANTSAGFSIVTYTGTGSAATIGHGLGVTPRLIIVKNRTDAIDWLVYTTAVDGTLDYFFLNTTAAKADSGESLPTSTVFSIASNTYVGANTKNYVAYCFAPVAGYSSFGSYTGNGSADGPFVYTGFRPALVIVKMSSSTGNWTILDYQREGYNVDNDPLFPNLGNAEGTTDLLDLTSNGFKVRTTDATFNTNAGTYVYAAWAQNPFQYARAR